MFKKILTNPQEHNPNDFIYLVHGLLDWNHNGISLGEMRNKVNRIKDPNQFYRASMIAHLDAKPAKERLGWYGGKVYRIGTFGQVGLILNPGRDDLIQIAWNCDIGSPYDPIELEKFVQKHKRKIKGPLALLTQIKGSEYNELILEGDKSTEVKGVFYKPIKDNDYETRDRGKRLAKIVTEIMQIETPVIELPASERKEYNHIKDKKERELRKRCDILRSESEIMMSFREFYGS